MLIIRTTTRSCYQFIKPSSLSTFPNRFYFAEKPPKMTNFAYELGLDKQYEKVKKSAQQQQTSLAKLMSVAIIAGLSIVGITCMIMLVDQRKRLKMLLALCKFSTFLSNLGYYLSPFEESQNKYFHQYITQLKEFIQIFKNELRKADISKQILFCVEQPKQIQTHSTIFYDVLRIMVESKKLDVEIKTRILEFGLQYKFSRLEQLALQILTIGSIKRKLLAIKYLQSHYPNYQINSRQKITGSIDTQLDKWQKLTQNNPTELIKFIFQSKIKQKAQILEIIN